jgi:CDP-diacylglycerol---glycerol-3-phosphate 3-phosphatidyltransferase
MNLPNSLTVTRIFLVPLLMVVLLTGRFPEREIWALSVFLFAALTDILDGYFARRRSQVTTLGKLLDPVADKLLISSALIALVQLGAAPAWMVVIIVGREFAVTGLRSIASAEGLTIDASRLGKYKMVSQVACCGFLIIGSRFPDGLLMATGEALLWVVAGLAVLSMYSYFRTFWNQIEENAQMRRRLEKEQRLKLLGRTRRKSDAYLKT